MNKNDDKKSDKSDKSRQPSRAVKSKSKSVGNVPVVMPVVPPEDKGTDNFPDIHPHLPQIAGPGGGALLLMISPVRTGKSTIISNMLLGDSDMGFYDAQERFHTTTIISNTIANDITSRFLKKAFDTHDSYDDSIIDGIVHQQKSYDKEDQPDIAVILDDCLGSIRREARINHLASRFRHFNIRLLIISSQNFRSCSPIIRQNATNVIVGSPFPNQKELGKMAEEYGDVFGGAENWLKIYKKATPEKYCFLHMNFQANPPEAYRCFEELIAVGENIMGEVPTLDEEEKPEQPEQPAVK
tara:strand:+ start:1434 stop:2327 length:894 start_codon:yes stop_codon:yes gene_type:complete